MNEKTELSPEHARVRARELAELFGNFNKSSHLFYDGRPLHIVAIEVLEWFAASPSSKSTEELPPLPEHAAAWVIPGDDGGALSKWVSATAFSEDEFTAPLFTARPMREYAMAALASSSIKEDGDRAEPTDQPKGGA